MGVEGMGVDSDHASPFEGGRGVVIVSRESSVVNQVENVRNAGIRIEAE